MIISKDKKKYSNLAYQLHLLRSNKLTFIGCIFIILLVAVAIFAPLIAPHVEHARGGVDPTNMFEPPQPAYPFGTDEAGRCIFSRIVMGSRISLGVGVFTIGLTLLIGIPLGAIAGYAGGFIDELIMRITDIFLSFPPLLLAMAVTAMLGPALHNVMIAIAITWWPWYTRLVRGQAISLRERPFVEAARATGVTPIRIVGRHIVPNTIAPIVVQASMDFGFIILTSASLSFLGLGAQPPMPEWGLMVSTGRTFFLTSWWVVTFPGLAIFATVLAFNLLGDGLREIMDPKTRGL